MHSEIRYLQLASEKTRFLGTRTVWTVTES